MEAIKTYLDNIFAAFPATKQVQMLKQEMLASMEEKYYELKNDGKSEHEAVGNVIANFGSIAEIAAELDLELNPADQSKAKSGPELYLSSTEAEDYLAQTKKSAALIAAGVWLILAGVSALLLSGTVVGIVILLVAIAFAALLFVTNGLKLGQYDSYGRLKIRLDAETYANIKQQRTAFMPRFTLHITGGIMAIILGVGAMVLLFHFAGADPFGPLGPPALFLLVVGLAVFLFITAGMTHEAFEILLGQGDYRYKVGNQQAERLIGTIAAAYWPLATAIYLLWSFLSGNWHITWLVWPVAGVLFAAISGGLATWFAMKED